MILYAGVRGYLDLVKTKEIGKFETLYLDFMKNNHQSLMDDIKRTGILSDEQDKMIGDILDSWLPTSGLELKEK